jgi:ubiquitin-protein ligase
MSIRNKRVIKELSQLNNYNIIFEKDWMEKPDATLTFTRMNINLSMVIPNDYPFSHPKMFIHTKLYKTDHVIWFLQKKLFYKNIVDKYNINIPCICCNTVTCIWTPTLTIKHMIDEFDKYYNEYYNLIKFNLIYKKIHGFDNLIYQKIIHFLY